jgi:hypothetical protein
VTKKNRVVHFCVIRSNTTGNSKQIHDDDKVTLIYCYQKLRDSILAVKEQEKNGDIVCNVIYNNKQKEKKKRNVYTYTCICSIRKLINEKQKRNNR